MATLDPIAAVGGASRTQAGDRAGPEATARQAAKDFEALFIAQMLTSMKIGIDPDSVMGGGKGEEAFQSMMTEQYGKAIAEMGGIGIADAIYKEILKAQEER